jgi:hypothetical protein
MLMQRFTFLFAALALTFAFGATSFAQAPPQTARIRGTIVSYAAGVLTVQGVGQVYKIALPDNVRVQWVAKSDLSKIGPNTYVGAVALPQPDGTLRAVSVQIFPEALRGVGEGSRPWDSIPNSSMTNATVTTIAPETIDKVEGRTMLVKYKDGEKKLFVPATAPITTNLPADASALTPGAHIIIMSATKNADGTFSSASVNVGKDGLTPPM